MLQRGPEVCAISLSDSLCWGALKSLQHAAITSFRQKNLQRLTIILPTRGTVQFLSVSVLVLHLQSPLILWRQLRYSGNSGLWACVLDSKSWTGLTLRERSLFMAPGGGELKGALQSALQNPLQSAVLLRSV